MEVLIALIIVAVLFTLVREVAKPKKSPQEAPAETRSVGGLVLMPFPAEPANETPSAQSPESRFKDRIRNARKEGGTKESLSAIVASFRDNIALEDMMDLAIDADVEKEEVVSIMREEGASLREIALMLVGRYEAPFDELIKLLATCAKSESPKEKAAEVLRVARDAESENGIEQESQRWYVMYLMNEFGISEEEAFLIIFQETEEGTFSSFAYAMNYFEHLEVLIPLVKSLEVNLTDEDEYHDLREEIDFETTARVLRAVGFTAPDILNAEEELVNQEEVDLLLHTRALLRAGFTHEEVLEATYDKSPDFYEYSLDAFLTEVLEAGIPKETLIHFLASKTEDVDIEDLEAELERNELMEFEERITFIHALIVAKREVAEAEAKKTGAILAGVRDLTDLRSENPDESSKLVSAHATPEEAEADAGPEPSAKHGGVNSGT